jgi:hypothetical protein
MLSDDPRLAKFTIDIADPRRAVDRMLKLLPIEAKFSTDSADPQRAKLRRLNELLK